MSLAPHPGRIWYRMVAMMAAALLLGACALADAEQNYPSRSSRSADPNPSGEKDSVFGSDGLNLFGGKKPDAGLSPHLPKDYELPKSGSMLIGEEGTMILPHVGPPHLYPEEKFKAYPTPELEPIDHYHEFVEAALGNGTAGADFSFSGPLTEAVLLANVANRFPGKTLMWDAEKLKFSNSGSASRYLRQRYRCGWHVDGL